MAASRFSLASDQFQGPDARHHFLGLLSELSGSDIQASLPAGANEHDFYYRMDLIALPKFVMSLTSASPVRFVTSPARVDVEQIVFQLPLEETRLFVEDKRDMLCTPGMGLVSLNSRRQIAGLHTAGRNLSLSLPLSMVTDYLKDASPTCDKTIAGDNPYAMLLRGYALIAHEQADRLTDAALNGVERHMAELAALGSRPIKPPCDQRWM